jgi:hypothetical protein
METSAEVKPKFEISSDLMANQRLFRSAAQNKHMQVLLADKPAFLSIDDADELILTYQKSKSYSGWEEINFSSMLRKELEVEEAKVIDFSIEKNRNEESSILVAGFNISGSERIFISESNNIEIPSWKEIELETSMKKMKLDSLKISYLNNKYFIFAYFINESGRIERYCKSSSGDSWKYYSLAGDFTDIIQTVVGRPNKERIDGTYTLGKLNNKKQLIYIPAYNEFDPDLAPVPRRLVVDNGVTDICTLSNNTQGASDNKFTDLFAAGGSKLFVYPYSNQKDLNPPTTVISSNLLSSVKNLKALHVNGFVYLWGLNNSKQIVYMFAKGEGIYNPEAWSPVLVMRNNINYVNPFPNGLFCYDVNEKILIGSDNLENGIWGFNEICLPNNAKDKAIMFSSYSTKIKVLDENDNPLSNFDVYIKGPKNMSLYIDNGLYCFDDEPLKITSNKIGEIKIVQVDSSPVALEFEILTNDKQFLSVNPSKDVVNKIFELNTAEKLQEAKIVNQSGGEETLIDKSVPVQNLNEVAKVIEKLDSAGMSFGIEKWNGASSRLNNDFSGLHIHFENGLISSSPLSQPVLNTYLEKSGIESTIENVLSFLRSSFNDIFDIIIEFANDAWNFMVKIGEKVLSFVITCVEEIVHCAVAIFEYIKVAIEKIVKFILYIFDIDDILLTKETIEKLINLSFDSIKYEVKDLSSVLQKKIEELIGYINQITKITQISDIGSQTMSEQKNKEGYSNAGDVHSNHLLDSLVDNFNNVTIINFSTTTKYTSAINGSLDELIKLLEQAADKEKEVVLIAIEEIKEQLLSDEINDLDFLAILQKLLGIVGTSILRSAENVITLIFDIVILAVDIIKDSLNAELYIPCVSEFLSFCGIKKFSMLDLVCIVPSFLSVVIYKIVTQKVLIDKELHDAVLQLKSLNELTSDRKCDELSINKNNFKKLYFPLKVISGGVSIAEVMFYLLIFVEAGDQQKKLDKAFNLVDGICYLVSDLIFSPLQDNPKVLGSVASKILSAIKYSPVVLSLIPGISQKTEDALKIAYAFTSLLSLAFNIVRIVQASDLQDSEEKTMFIVNQASLIPDNLRNVADGILVKKSLPPQVFAIVLGARTFCGIGYGAMQIIVGAEYNRYKEEK